MVGFVVLYTIIVAIRVATARDPSTLRELLKSGVFPTCSNRSDFLADVHIVFSILVQCHGGCVLWSIIRKVGDFSHDTISTRTQKWSPDSMPDRFQSLLPLSWIRWQPVCPVVWGWLSIQYRFTTPTHQASKGCRSVISYTSENCINGFCFVSLSRY